MTDADALRRQMATSTDPRWLEREALRADLEEAKRHIEALTAFFMDNVLWARASDEARAFACRLMAPAPAKGAEDVDHDADIRASERKKCWEIVNAMIRRGPTQGNGCDDLAQRNGLVMAANALLPPVEPREVSEFAGVSG